MSGPKEAEISIRKGSKSFSLAAMFFPPRQWEATCLVYHWCRYCDDVIDNGESTADISLLKNELHHVLVKGEKSDIEAFNSLSHVAVSFHIPSHYPEELLNGMEMDVSGTVYKTFSDLDLYCYRVASTVGLMMCYVMGLFNLKALENAAHLGMAMQLTNIARDVKEDYENGRIYLPEECLNDKGIRKETLMNDEQSLFRVVLEVLNRAENYYKSGLQGLSSLPVRSAFVILSAALIYREIGETIRKNGPLALRKRTVVPLHRKMFLILKAFILTIFSLPERLTRKNTMIKIDRIWSPL